MGKKKEVLKKEAIAKETKAKEVKTKEGAIKERKAKESKRKESEGKENGTKERASKEIRQKEKPTPKELDECIKAAQASLQDVIKDVKNQQEMLDNLSDGSGCQTNACRCMVKAQAKKQLQIAQKRTEGRKKTVVREAKVVCMVNARAKKNKKEQEAAMNRCKNLSINDLDLVKYKTLLVFKPKTFPKSVADLKCAFETAQEKKAKKSKKPVSIKKPDPEKKAKAAVEKIEKGKKLDVEKEKAAKKKEVVDKAAKKKDAAKADEVKSKEAKKKATEKVEKIKALKAKASASASYQSSSISDLWSTH